VEGEVVEASARRPGLVLLRLGGDLLDGIVANMASYAISSSLTLVIHDNMIIGTNLIILACLRRHF
jgi:hypothetical protein